MSTSEENIQRFEALLNSVQREGMKELIQYIRNNTDFYCAPASTRFHLSCKGGLLQHSLNVFDALLAKKSNPLWGPLFEAVPYDSLIIVALMHDLCKANYYVKGFRNQKTYDSAKVAAAEPWKVKSDECGDYVWEMVPSYNVDDQLPLGHGEKSVILLQRYLPLMDEEIMAIRWHMGFSLEKELYSSVGAVMEKYPLVLALYEADLEASKLIEVDQTVDLDENH